MRKSVLFAMLAVAVALCAVTLPALAGSPTPTVGANVVDGRIMLSDWTAGSTVHVVVDADSNPANGTLAAGDVTMDDGTWKDTQNIGGTDLQGLLAAGQHVTASQGATTKTLQIAPLAIGGVDLASHTVTGTADPGTALTVHVWDNSGGDADWHVDTTAGLTGEWSADFTGIHTIVRGDDGGATIADADDDWTQADWHAANPNVWVIVAPSNQLNLEEWPAGSTVHVVVDADSNLGNGTLFSADVDIDGDGNGNMDQGFIEDHGGLHVGQYVTASQGSVTKILLISSMGVTKADTAADTVGGWAPAGSQVHVWDDNGGDSNGTANGSGNWSFHLDGADIVPGDHGMAAVTDVDGDATRADWTATGLTVKTVSKIKRGKSIVLTISGRPVDLGGEWVRVEAKKPGKSWSLVTRIVIPRTGAWQTSYATTKTSKVGTYAFRAVYAGGWADLKGSSTTINVKVTK